jgi:hypothetical protein
MKKGTISEIFFGIFVVMKCLRSNKKKLSTYHYLCVCVCVCVLFCACLTCVSFFLVV